ncbi:hypothetical protein EDB83DRAFT_2551180 [Lactarius deliciosus]|nr:hypothetical protein EDB83DRAFT_2551180 [Lactarius deliciosus]
MTVAKCHQWQRLLGVVIWHCSLVLACADSDSKNWVTISFYFILLSSVALAVLDCFHQTLRPSEHRVPLDCLTLADDVKTAGVRLKHVPEGAEVVVFAPSWVILTTQLERLLKRFGREARTDYLSLEVYTLALASESILARPTPSHCGFGLGSTVLVTNSARNSFVLVLRLGAQATEQSQCTAQPALGAARGTEPVVSNAHLARGVTSGAHLPQYAMMFSAFLRKMRSPDEAKRTGSRRALSVSPDGVAQASIPGGRAVCHLNSTLLPSGQSDSILEHKGQGQGIPPSTDADGTFFGLADSAATNGNRRGTRGWNIRVLRVWQLDIPVPVGGKWNAGAVYHDHARDTASGTARDMLRGGEREARTRTDGTGKTYHDNSLYTAVGLAAIGNLNDDNIREFGLQGGELLPWALSALS